MNKVFGCVLLVGVLTCVGCITLTPHDAKAPAPTVPINAARPASPPVTSDQVTPATAHRIAQSLAEEIERDRQEP